MISNLIRRFLVILSFCLILQFPALAQYSQSAPKVEVAEVISSSLVPQNTIEGRVVAGQDLAIVTNIDGIVTLAPWREGDFVKKGDLIARQDTTKTEIKLDRLLLQQAETGQLIVQTQATLDFELTLLSLAKEQTLLQQSRLDRLEELAAENIVPKDRLDEALRTHLQSRQAEVNFQKNIAKLESDLVQTQIKSDLISVEIADARADIASSRLVAPASGQLVSMSELDEKYFRQGEMVAQIRLHDGYEIEVDIPVTMLISLRQVKTVSGFDANGDELTASLRSELPKENQKTSTRPVRFTITSDLTNALMADQARVQLKIPTSSQQTMITIPSDAIIPYDGGVFVFVIQGEKVLRRNISIGETIADRIVIMNGLTKGELVVTKGNEGLRNDMAVTIVQP